MDSIEVCSDIKDTPILTIEDPESDSFSIEAFNAIQAIGEIQETEHGINKELMAMEYSPISPCQGLKVKASSDIQSFPDNKNSQFNSLKRQCAFNDIEVGNRKKRLTVENKTFVSLDESCDALLNGDASSVFIRDNGPTCSQTQAVCIVALEDRDFRNQADNCLVIEMEKEGSSAMTSVSGVINNDNSLADEFAEFMASAFVTTSCSRDEEPSLDIISHIKCNGSNELPEDECNGSNELPEDGCHGYNELSVVDCNDSKQLAEHECNGSNQFSEEECTGLNELPEEKYNGSKEFPEEECNESNQLPVEECNESNQLPVEECNKSNQLPEEECNESNQLPVKECNESNQLPVEECNESNQLPEEECSVSNHLPEQCYNSNELPEEECNGSNEVLEEEGTGSNQLPEEEGTSSNQLPEERTGSNQLLEGDGTGSNELPEEECSGSNALPKECDGSKELPEEEDTGSNEFLIVECKGSNDLTVEECDGSNELPGANGSNTSKCMEDCRSDVLSETSIHPSKSVSEDSMSTLSANEIGISSKCKNNESNGIDVQDHSEILDIEENQVPVVSALESQNIEEYPLDISDVPILRGCSLIADGTTKEVCEESTESMSSPVPRRSTETYDLVDLDLGFEDAGLVNSGFSPNVSQCSEADSSGTVTKTNEKSVRRSTRKISQSDRASTVIEVVVKESPKKGLKGSVSRKLNSRQDTLNKTINNSSNSNTLAPQNGRPMGKFLMDIGLQVVSKQIYKDLINIQKVRMHTNDTEQDRQLLDKLVVSHKNLIEKNEPYKCGPPLRCRCLFKCNSTNVLEHHREHSVQEGSGKKSVYHCCYCKGTDADTTFYREGLLVRHMKARHERNYRAVKYAKHMCFFCKFEAGQVATMILHRRTCVRQFQLRNNLEPSTEDRDIPLVEVLKNYKIVPKNQPRKTQAFEWKSKSAAPTQVVKVLPKPKQVVLVAKQIAQQSSSLKSGSSYVGKKLLAPVPLNGNSRLPNQTSLSGLEMALGANARLPTALFSQSQRLSAPIIIAPVAKSQKLSAAPILSNMQVCPICNGIVKDATVMVMHMQICHPNVNASTFGPNPTVVSESNTGICYLCRPPRTFINQSFLQQHIACHHSVAKKQGYPVVRGAAVSTAFDVSQLRTRCRMCFTLIVGNPIDHMSSMHMITLWMMLKRLFCYLCPDQFVGVADFENHMVCRHAPIFPTHEQLWSRIQLTIPTAETQRAGFDATKRKFGEIKCPRCDARHLSRIALYRHFYLVHGFGTISKTCSVCNVYVEDELSHMLTVHVRSCSVVAIRLNDDTFQKYYARYLDSQELDGSLSVRSRPPLGTVVLKQCDQNQTVTRTPGWIPKPVNPAAVTVTKPCEKIITVRPRIPPAITNIRQLVKPKYNDEPVIILDDDDDDDVVIEKAKVAVIVKEKLHESVVLTSDDSDNDDHSDDDDSDDVRNNSLDKDDVQDVWDDGELVHQVDDDVDDHRQVIDCMASHSSRKSSVCSDLSSEDIEELNLDESVEKLEEDVSAPLSAPVSDGVYPLHLSSMVPSPRSRSPSPSERNEEDPSSSTSSEHMEVDNSDIDTKNVVMEIDGDTIIIVNEDSD